MKLTNKQIRQAKRLWKKGEKDLGEIADEIGCSPYDLSPWLYAPDLRRIVEEEHERHSNRL